jgi:hypothetical protein
MMIRRFKLLLISLAVTFLTSSTLSGQDFGKLRERVLKLWELRQKGDKLAALQFVEPQSQNAFLQLDPPPILKVDPNIGFRFTDNPNLISVTVDVQLLVDPKFGEAHVSVQQKWEWRNRNWFMTIEPPTGKTPGFLLDTTDRAAPEKPREFHLTNAVLDLGLHMQGENVTGQIPFQAKRDDIFIVRAFQTPKGLYIQQPVWTKPEEGYIPYVWDTLLVWEDLPKQTVRLEVTDVNDLKTTVELEVSGRVDGKIAFAQMPEIVDPAKEGELELQFRNLMDTPLKLLTVSSSNPAYRVTQAAQDTILPGMYGLVRVHHSAQADPTAAALNFEFAEHPVTPLVTVPLNVKLPAPAPATSSYTREQLEKIRGQIPLPVLKH